MDARKGRLAIAVTGLLLLGGGCHSRMAAGDAFADMWWPGVEQQRSAEGVWIEDRINMTEEISERVDKVCRAYVERYENSRNAPVHLESYRRHGRVWVVTYEIEMFVEEREDGSFGASSGYLVDVWMDAYSGKVIAITRRSPPEREGEK